jgi:hypothetical protein
MVHSDEVARCNRSADAGEAGIRPKGRCQNGYPWALIGVWRSLVARSVRVGEVPSSNLGTPMVGTGETMFPPCAPSSAVGRPGFHPFGSFLRPN